jgi:hypothetical protein
MSCHCVSPTSTGSTLTSFGKHKGHTFQDADENVTGYALWCCCQQAPSEAITHFVEYCRTAWIRGPP